MKRLTSLLAAALLACGLTGCTTTRTTTTVDPVTGVTNIVTVKVPDPAKTAQVKDVAETLIATAFRRIAVHFPKEAEKAAAYASAAGAILCEMNRTEQFDPIVLESGLANIALPLIEDEQARLIVLDVRDAVLLVYKTFWNQRFVAELPDDKWPGAVTEILCNAIDRALRDAGRPGVKPVVVENTIGPTTKEALRKVLGQ